MAVWLRWDRVSADPDLGFANMRPICLETQACQTVQATGLGGVAMQYHLEDDGVPMHRRADEGTARCLEVDAGQAAPTVISGGVGPVNTSQYHVAHPTNPSSQEGMPAKPAYAVPSVAAIKALPWNGLTVASTFSGCGGSCLGYRMAGFRVGWASEFVPAARDSYLANFSDAVLDPRDVRTVKPAEVLAALGMGVGELDLLDGSPPCASFSTAGRRQEGWGKVKAYSDVEQRTDDLFLEYVRLIDGIRPRAFVAENVSGLVKGVAKGFFVEVLKALKACGYRVAVRVLDAARLGVPQHRQRAIFVGVREDLAAKDGSPIVPCHPAPLPWIHTVREAIPWIAAASEETGGAWGAGDVTDMAAPTVRAGGVAHLKAMEAEADISRFAVGQEAAKLKPGEQSERYSNLVRAPLDGASPAVTANGAVAGIASVMHPTAKRKFSIAELRRICAFPDCFVLTGNYARQWERLGRAVPPVMMAWIARAVRDKILLADLGCPPWRHDPPFITDAVRIAKEVYGRLV